MNGANTQPAPRESTGADSINAAGFRLSDVEFMMNQRNVPDREPKRIESAIGGVPTQR